MQHKPSPQPSETSITFPPLHHSHMATTGDNTMGFISDTLPLNRSFDDPEDPDSAYSCGCFQGFFIRIRPRRKRGSLSTCAISRPLEEDVLKNAGPGSGSRSLLCGQKWKLIIQKLRSSGTGRKRAAVNFQYDARSYALNFDDGFGRGEDGSAYFSFSDRYVTPPPPPTKMNAAGSRLAGFRFR